jgi:hypothetical protein
MTVGFSHQLNLENLNFFFLSVENITNSILVSRMFLLSYNGRVKTVVSIQSELFLTGCVIGPSITDNERGRPSIFVSEKPLKPPAGRPDSELFSPLYWLIYTWAIEILPPISILHEECVRTTLDILFHENSESDGQLFVSFYESAPVGSYVRLMFYDPCWRSPKMFRTMIPQLML